MTDDTQKRDPSQGLFDALSMTPADIAEFKKERAMDNTQKRIAEIRGSAALRDRDGRVDNVYADKAVRQDIPWLLEQLDKANYQLSESQKRVAEAVRIGNRNAATIAERDAEIVRLKESACTDYRCQHRGNCPRAGEPEDEE